MSQRRRLLIVEDDAKFAAALQRSFERKGYDVRHASEPLEAVEVLRAFCPGYAVVDLKLRTDSGLACVQALHKLDPSMLIVVLTGFASIATAVEAIKLGACHYLAKPSDNDDIEAAFAKSSGDPASPITARRPRSRPWNGRGSKRLSRRRNSTSPKPRGGWECTVARSHESWKSDSSSELLAIP